MTYIQDKKKNWSWKDIRYIDPYTEVTCSGGLDGKPEHEPTHMVMGINDVVLVCPICNTIYGNEERMNGTGVQAQMVEAERRKEMNNNKSLLKIDPSQRIGRIRKKFLCLRLVFFLYHYCINILYKKNFI